MILEINKRVLVEEAQIVPEQQSVGKAALKGAGYGGLIGGGIGYGLGSLGAAALNTASGQDGQDTGIDNLPLLTAASIGTYGAAIGSGVNALRQYLANKAQVQQIPQV